jgi:SAM-dependent methyltransferase
MNPSRPPEQDPATPAFWDSRFRAGVTPWEAGGVPAALAGYVSRHPAPCRVLVPGCGSAWETRFLAERGFDVTALDFSEAAVERARTTLGPHADRVLRADFFAFAPSRPFDLVYERTFLCALPRDRWPGYAARMAELIRPGGLLVGFFFFRDEPQGPPFGTTPAALASLLGDAFVREDDQPVTDSVPLFAGRERWQAWRRIGDPCA